MIGPKKGRRSATWTISADPLQPGTPMWTLPADGETVQKIVEAIPTFGGLPDLFSVEGNAGDNFGVIRGITIDGTPVWSTSLTNLDEQDITSDPSGGLVVLLDGVATRIDPVSGQADWAYARFSNPVSDTVLGVHPNGTIFIVSSDTATEATPVSPIAQSCTELCGPGVISALDSGTGQIKFVVPFPSSSVDIENVDSDTEIGPASTQVAAMSVMPDGTTVFEAASVSDQIIGSLGTDAVTYHASAGLSLITVQQDGASATQVLDSSGVQGSDPNGFPALVEYFPGEVIPDGQGGLLAMWSKESISSGQDQSLVVVNMVTHIANGSSTTYSLPYDVGTYDSPISGVGETQESIVLGDNGIVFATDNSRTIVSSPTLVAFDMNSGAVKWTYEAAADIITIIAASNGGGVVAKTTSSGVDTVLRFDSSGTATTDAWTASGIINFGGGFWQGFPSSGGITSGYAALPPELSGSPWVTADGLGSKIAKQNYSVPDFSQEPPNQTTIVGVVQELFDALPLASFPGSSSCNAWLKTGETSLQVLQTLLPSGWGHGDVSVNGQTSFSIGAFTGGNPAPPGVPPGVATVVNDSGPFFHTQYPLGNSQFHAYSYGPRGYPGNDFLTQASISIHELAHQAEPPFTSALPWQQKDGGNLKAVESNDRLVNTVCGDMIRALPSINMPNDLPPNLSPGLSPASGAVGTTVTINGSNFGAAQGTSVVAFNGTAARTIVKWTSTQIEVIVPNGATTGNVVVTVSAIPATGPVFTVQ